MLAPSFPKAATLRSIKPLAIDILFPIKLNLFTFGKSAPVTESQRLDVILHPPSRVGARDNAVREIGFSRGVFLVTSRRRGAARVDTMITKLDKFQLQQIALTASFILAVGGVGLYNALNPRPTDYMLIAGLHQHPAAAILGALLPLLISTPFVYWMMGRTLRSVYLRSRAYNLFWQTCLENDPEIAGAVERLSALSQKNVEEFRVLLLRHRDCDRAKEFEEEAIRRVQGPAFVGDPTLCEAYISLNREGGRFGDELVRVVSVIGRPKDLNRTINQTRNKVLAGAKVLQAEDNRTAKEAPAQAHEPRPLFAARNRRLEREAERQGGRCLN